MRIRYAKCIQVGRSAQMSTVSKVVSVLGHMMRFQVFSLECYMLFVHR